MDAKTFLKQYIDKGGFNSFGAMDAYDVIDCMEKYAALRQFGVIESVCDCTEFDEPTHVIKCKKCGKMYDQSY